VRELLLASWRELVLLLGALRILWQELLAIRLTGARARQSTMTALSTALSVAAALALHMDYVWWAAMSGFMSMQATRPGSVHRALLRIAGTASGAVVALVLTPWLAYDHVAGSLFIFCVGALGALGFMVSASGYAWLFAAITVNLVVLSSLQNPLLALHYAFYRTAEVLVGSIIALLVAFVLAPDSSAAQSPARGWSQLWERDWRYVQHAMRAGLTVMLLPWVWSWFVLPSLTQMAVTVAAIMAVPVLAADPLETGRQVAGHSLQRLLGCLLGGLAGLALLALSMTEFIPWILSLAAVVWIGCYLQTSQRGVGYVGTQATIVLIMTLVQGWGPPGSLLPGIDRFAGIMEGLAILMLVSLVTWTESARPSEAPTTLQQAGQQR
jgi:uncharacterized membrane protein YccC